MSALETIDKDHGRLEIRRYSLSDELGWLESRGEWAGLSAIGRVESISQVGDLPAIRRAALNLIRRNDSSKPGIGRRRMRACSNDSRRSQLLSGSGLL